jgi:FkbM family methyltransferase
VKKPSENMLNTEIPSELGKLLCNQKGSLLSQCKLYWFYGDWSSLANVEMEHLQNHSDRAKIILLVASAYQQLEDFETAQSYCHQALEWGCEPKAVAKLCIAGAYNILGRIAAIQGDQQKIEQAFLESVDIGDSKDLELVAHSRAVREMAKLGLLPQAAKMIDQRLKNVVNSPSKIKNISAQTKVLEAELELLSHELNISLQRNQLYHQENRQNFVLESDLEKGSPEYIEYLKQISTSQLGQDIWILEKTGFKRNGFFVEFGATDGVLLSNSFLLEKEFGWHGVCAEPNPKFFEQLQQNRNCIVSNACISGKTGDKVRFILAQEYGGTYKHMTDGMHKDKREGYLEQGSEMLLETISLNDFLIANNAPKKIDYLSIDTEGSEFEILENFPFDDWDVACLTIEHNFTANRDKVFKLLDKFGYERTEAQFDDWFYKNYEKGNGI